MQLNPHGHTLVPQDCWNQIVSYKTNFADLKTWRLVSSSMPQTIELCCQNILKELDLNDEDSPALAEDRIHVISFKRILSLEDLIQRWTKREESEDDDFLQDPSQLDSSALQDLVSKKFKQLNFPLHSLKDFFEMIHCMLNYSKKVVTVTAVIYYFTSSIFKGHPGNEDLKKFIIRNSYDSLIAIEQSDTKTIQKKINEIYNQSTSNLIKTIDLIILLTTSLVRFKIKSFEQIIKHIKEKKEFFNDEKKYFCKPFKIENDIVQKSEQTSIDLFIDLLYKIKPHIPSDFVHLVVNADCIPLLNRLKEKPILYDLESETETIFNLSAVDENREQPLHQVKSIEAAKILIEGGAEINKENTIGQTPLTKALLNNRPDIAKCLIENGAKIEPQDEELMANTKYQK